MKLVAYIRGGLGDVWPAISAIKQIIEVNNISKFDVTIITDSVYYFRYNYPRSFEKFSLDMLHKITPNVVMVSPWINNNFKLTIDETTNDFSQEYADKCVNEFMFWRPQSLKDFVRRYLTSDTIFIDSLFSECIMIWRNNKYERVNNNRATFKFNPAGIEKKCINEMLKGKHILIHVRKKHGDYGTSPEDEFYTNIIKFCNEKGIKPIVIGAEINNVKGDFIDLIGRNPLSFEGMGYLIDKCNIMLGNDSGFSVIKLFQQQKDKLLIMNYPTRRDRSGWLFRAIKRCYNPKKNQNNFETPDKSCSSLGYSNCLLLNAQEDNIEKIKQVIGDYK